MSVSRHLYIVGEARMAPEEFRGAGPERWHCVSVSTALLFRGTAHCREETVRAEFMDPWMFSSVRHGMACSRTWGLARGPLPLPRIARGRRSVTASFLLTGLTHATRRGRSGRPFEFFCSPKKLRDVHLPFLSRDSCLNRRIKKMGSSANTTIQPRAWAPNPMAL